MRSQSVNDQYPHVGLSAYIENAVWSDPARAKEIAALLIDTRWPWIPWWVSYSGIHKRDDLTSVRVGGKNGFGPILDGLLSEKMSVLHMDRAKGDGNFATVMLELDRQREQWGEPFQLRVTCRSAELLSGKSVGAWLELMHELLTAVCAANATIGAWPTYTLARCDTWLTEVILDTPKGDLNLGLPPNFNAQTSSYCKWYKKMGRTYARHPRWGTYLHEDHLAAIGGVERVHADVAPALVERAGSLTYIQLTESIESAMTAEAEARRVLLERLMAPILPGASRESFLPQ